MLTAITAALLMSTNMNAATHDVHLDNQSEKYKTGDYASISHLTPSHDGTEFYGIYGSYTDNNSLYVMDAVTGKTTKKIKLPDVNVNPNTYGPFDMMMSPDGKMIYIIASTKVIKIDVVNKEISAVISTGQKSSDRSMDISGDGLKAVAADYADYGGNDETYIHIVDTHKNILSDAIPKRSAQGGFYRAGFANLVVDKLTNKVYLIDGQTDDSIAILDLNTKKLQLNAIPLSSSASIWSMAIDSSRGLLYIIEPDKYLLDIIDINARKIVEQVKINEMRPDKVTLSPDGNRAYIHSNRSSNVIVLDTKSRRMIKTLYIPSDELQISSNGKLIYTLTYSHIFGESWSNVHIYDAETGKEIKSFPVERV